MTTHQCGSCESIFFQPTDTHECPECGSGNWVIGYIDDEVVGMNPWWIEQGDDEDDLAHQRLELEDNVRITDNVKGPSDGAVVVKIGDGNIGYDDGARMVIFRDGTGHIEGKTYSITANGQRRANNFVLKLTPADVRAITAGMGLHAYATLDLDKGWREGAEWRDEMEAAGKADAFTYTADEVVSRFHPDPVQPPTLGECVECGFPIDPDNEVYPAGSECICDLKEGDE